MIRRRKDHIEIGMGTQTTPSRNPTRDAPSDTSIALLFDKKVPPLKAAEIKKMLAPVLDFEKRSPTENYVETLPAPVQEAIKQKKAIEGMTPDQVLLAMGRPRHKERSTIKDGVDTEDWGVRRPARQNHVRNLRVLQGRESARILRGPRWLDRRASPAPIKARSRA